MEQRTARTALGAALLGALLATAGCGDRIEDTEMAQPPQANVEINRQDVDVSHDGKAHGVSYDTMDRAAAIEAAVVNRSLDPDVRIANDVRTAFASALEFGTTKIDVHSEDGSVTLRGQAPDPAARARAADIARSVREVRSVDNQLTLG